MKENAALEKYAADRILDEGVSILVRTPFFFRLFRWRTFKISVYSPYYGTLMRVASLYLSTGITQQQLKGISHEEALAIVAAHGKAISKAVAYAILNHKTLGWWFTKPLARYLRNNAKPAELLNIINLVAVLGGTTDFMLTTRSVRMIQVKMTAPRTGQTTEGS